MRVELKLAGAVGDRAGGLQVAALGLLPVPRGADVGAALVSASEAEPGKVDPVDSANQQHFGARPSGWGEILKILMRRYGEKGDALDDAIAFQILNRNKANGKGGPNAEVRPQWLADP